MDKHINSNIIPIWAIINNKMTKPTILDVLTFMILLIIPIILFPVTSPDEEVVITSSGKEYIYPASEDRIIPVEGPLGETLVEIRNGDVRIISSPCPEKTCLEMKIGNAICCLPNRVLVEKRSFEGEDVDEISF